MTELGIWMSVDAMMVHYLVEQIDQTEDFLARQNGSAQAGLRGEGIIHHRTI